MTTHHAVAQEFNTIHKESWEFLAIYLREMEECLSSLTKAIEEDNTSAARAELHQMMGGTDILNYVRLKEKLILLQSIVKSSKPSKDGNYLLTEIQFLLDELFKYLMEYRPKYEVHLLTKTQSTVSTLIPILEKAQVTCTQNGTLEECMSWLSSNEADLVLLDDDGDTFLTERLSNELDSACIDIPILLLIDHPVSKAQERFGSFLNINGAVLKSTTSEQLLEGIKTTVNGRDYWPSENNATQV